MRLMVNERPLETRISPTEWAEQWRPLLAKLLETHKQHPKRLMVAIVGPPGSGKSVFAEQLNWIIFRGFLDKEARSVALTMDGFHYPNTYLETHKRQLSDGAEIPLSWVKGQPDTFNMDALRNALRQLRAAPEYVYWPGYSRITHDPVPNAHKIHASTNIVFVDGNYLISNQAPFTGLGDFFDLKMYVEVPTAKILSNLMERHMKTGKTVDEAKSWVKRIDLPNARIAEQSKALADVVVVKTTDDDLTNVIWKGEILAETYRNAIKYGGPKEEHKDDQGVF
jgi:pantothenate kinase